MYKLKLQRLLTDNPLRNWNLTEITLPDIVYVMNLTIWKGISHPSFVVLRKMSVILKRKCEVIIMKLNTVFKPPKKVSKEAVRISKHLAEKYETRFILDGENFPPHITIYHASYPRDSLEEVKTILRRRSKEGGVLRLKFKDIGGNQGYVGVVFEKDKAILDFHKLIVGSLCPLRKEEKEAKKLSYEMEFTEEQRENIKKNGYPDAWHLYKPHLTFTRLEDFDKTEEVMKRINWPIENFEVDTIALYKTGENGTCTKQIASFNLR